MSAASEQVASALDALAGKCLAAGDMGKALLLNEATVHALLAVEARLGEMVEQQQLANVLAAFHGRGSAYYLDDAGIEHDNIVVWISRRLHSVVDPEATS